MGQSSEGIDKREDRYLQNNQENKQELSNHLYHPFNCIGLIRAQLKRSFIYGTGFLIAADLVLTAASNLYDTVNKVFLKNVVFCLQKPQPKHIFQSYQVKSYKVCKQYHQNYSDHKGKQRSYNYALLKLNQKIPLEQYLSIQVETQQIGNIMLSGYCLEQIQKGEPQIDSYRQYRSEGVNKNVSDYLMYSIEAKQSQNGSPILMKENNSWVVIGIHTKYKPSLVIGQEIIERLRAWEALMHVSQINAKFKHGHKQVAENFLADFIDNSQQASVDPVSNKKKQKKKNMAKNKQDNIDFEYNNNKYPIEQLNKQHKNKYEEKLKEERIREEWREHMKDEASKDKVLDHEKQYKNHKDAMKKEKHMIEENKKNIEEYNSKRKSQTNNLGIVDEERLQWRDVNRHKLKKIVENMTLSQTSFHRQELGNYGMLQIIECKLIGVNLVTYLAGCNNLTSIGVKWLTSKEWPILKTLFLNDNRIETLNGWNTFNLPELIRLNLDVNSLYELPNNIRALRYLKELYISHNNFSTKPEILNSMFNLIVKI